MLVKPKDRREKKSNAGLVYQYECKCKKVYIGETGRSLKTRESEHKRAIRNGDENHSGISKHVLETGPTILWDEVQILAYETNWRKRKIKEGIFIAKTNCNLLLNTKPGIPMNNSPVSMTGLYSNRICWKSKFELHVVVSMTDTTVNPD